MNTCKPLHTHTRSYTRARTYERTNEVERGGCALQELGGVGEVVEVEPDERGGVPTRVREPVGRRLRLCCGGVCVCVEDLRGEGRGKGWSGSVSGRPKATDLHVNQNTSIETPPIHYIL